MNLIKPLQLNIFFVAIAFLIAPKVNAKIAENTSSSTSEFFTSVSKKFLRNYFPLRGFGYCRAVASFQLEDDLNLTDIRLEKPPTSGKAKKRAKLADNALIQAVKTLSPLSAAPSELKRPVRIYLIIDGRSSGPTKTWATTNAQDALSEK